MLVNLKMIDPPVNFTVPNNTDIIAESIETLGSEVTKGHDLFDWISKNPQRPIEGNIDDKVNMSYSIHRVPNTELTQAAFYFFFDFSDS